MQKISLSFLLLLFLHTSSWELVSNNLLLKVYNYIINSSGQNYYQYPFSNNHSINLTSFIEHNNATKIATLLKKFGLNIPGELADKIALATMSYFEGENDSKIMKNPIDLEKLFVIIAYACDFVSRNINYEEVLKAENAYVCISEFIDLTFNYSHFSKLYPGIFHYNGFALNEHGVQEA